MSIYVDDARLPYGRMKMCHMIADTPAELNRMAEAIGVHPRWIQYPGTWQEHYDICLSKRKVAVALGAKEVTQRELAQMRKSRRPSSDGR